MRISKRKTLLVLLLCICVFGASDGAEQPTVTEKNSSVSRAFEQYARDMRDKGVALCVQLS